MSLTLTPEQLRELTGKGRSDAQRRELDHMGIKYRVRRDGSLAVLVSDVSTAPSTMPPEPELQP